MLEEEEEGEEVVVVEEVLRTVSLSSKGWALDHGESTLPGVFPLSVPSPL